MNVAQALHHGQSLLVEHDISDPILVAEVLLMNVMAISKVQLYLNGAHELTREQEQKYFQFIERHIKGEPVAYITGYREFYGLEFYVDSRVLIPRPETELLVEKVIDYAHRIHVNTVVDVGTGCGAIAIILALKFSNIRIYAVDISREALEVARLNISKHGVAERITLIKGDLLLPVTEQPDLIIANLPYVKTSDLSEPSIRFEPKLALNGGPDGLSVIRRLISQAKDKLKKGGSLFMEVGKDQIEPIKSLINEAFQRYSLQVVPDYAGIERIVHLKNDL